MALIYKRNGEKGGIGDDQEAAMGIHLSEDGPRPPSKSLAPVKASTMRAYCLSGLREVSTGRLHRILLSLVKDSCASAGIGPPEFRESFRRSRLRGAERVV